MCISIDFNARPSKSALIYQISFPCSDAVNFPLITSFSIHSKPSCKDPVCQTDRDLPYILSWGKTSDEGGSSFHAAGCPLWRKSYIQTDCGGVWMLKLPSMDELLTLILKLMNIVIHSTIHLSYLKVTDYFTEIMCLGLQMKTTQDHSLSSRQIKFQTLLL